jgi:hypothetical protein
MRSPLWKYEYVEPTPRNIISPPRSRPPRGAGGRVASTSSASAIDAPW